MPNRYSVPMSGTQQCYPRRVSISCLARGVEGIYVPFCTGRKRSLDRTWAFEVVNLMKIHRHGMKLVLRATSVNNGQLPFKHFLPRGVHNSLLTVLKQSKWKPSLFIAELLIFSVVQEYKILTHWILHRQMATMAPLIALDFLTRSGYFFKLIKRCPLCLKCKRFGLIHNNLVNPSFYRKSSIQNH